MKRARDRWLVHLFIGVLAIAFTINPKAEAVKATSLIFKTTTTTTTEASEVDSEDAVDGEAEAGPTTPSSNLTGIPQIDYIHDPNLPRELNGYNLSSYPFYETVPPPEEMDFKCDGLHDGFYASVPHKCQVYHHCLYGTRYDFLCANYTAFDQKTFICHFVSEVDCVNSPKYFNRNDALYIQPNDTEKIDWTFVKPKFFSSGAKIIKSDSVFTSSSNNKKRKPSKPKIVKNDMNFFAPPNDDSIEQESSAEQTSTMSSFKFRMFKSKKKNSHKTGNEALYKATTSSTVAPPTTTRTTTTTPPPPPPQQRPRPGNRRRPSRRRRPQYDFYDDDYYPTARDEDDYYDDDRRRPYNEGRNQQPARRKRPRPSQRRPAYDDYEDDRFDRRQEGRTRYDEDYEDRRSYDRPRKPGRRPTEDRERERTEDDRPYERNKKTRPNDEKRGSSDHDRRTYDDDRRSFSDDRRRRPFRDDDDRPSRDGDSKEESEFKDERPFRDERPLRDNRPHRDERPLRDEQRPGNERRPIKDDSNYDDYEEEKKPEPTGPSASGLVKPNGGSIYSQPRVPPKIARPVPSNEKDKYKYVTSPSTKVPVKPTEEDYYDDYETESLRNPPAPKSSTRPRFEQVEKERPKPSIERTRLPSESENSKRNSGSNYNQRKPEYHESRKSYSDDTYEDEDEPRPKKLNSGRGGTRYSSRKRPPKTDDEYYYDEEEPKRSSSNQRKETKKDERENSTREPSNRYRDHFEETERLPIKTEKEVTTIKPFFQRNKPTTTPATTTTTSEANLSGSDKTEVKPHPYVRVVKRPFLPSRGGSPYLPRGLQPLGGKNFNKTASTTTSTTTTTTSTTTENIIHADYSYETDYDSKDDKSYYNGGSSQESAEKNHSSQQSEKKVFPTIASTSAEKQNFRQYSYTQKPIPKPIEEKRRPFLNSQKYEKESSKEYSSSVEDFRPQEKIKITYDQNFKNGGVAQPTRYLSSDYSKAPDRLQTFKPSPQISEPYKPTNRPFTPKIPENISIKHNLADPTENDYDVTLNDALNPTISNLTPVRNFPSPFIVPVERDYTFARFRNGYNQDQQSNGYSNYQQQSRPVQGKFENSQRFAGNGYVKNEQASDSVASASELIGGPHVISVRTPQSFYIQHPRYSSGYSADETNSGLRPSHVAYRQVDLGDYA